MMKTDYHIHSTYCDGSSTLRESVVQACSMKFNSIGFTSHFPLVYQNDWTMKKENVTNYLLEIETLKLEFKDKIQIYSGMEIDYYINTQDISSFAYEIIPKLDYYIGSIHGIGLLPNGEVAYIDYLPHFVEDGIKYCYQNNAQHAVEAYYAGLSHFVEKLNPPIIGHFDIIKKNNSILNFIDENEKWYKDAWYSTLQTISGTNSIIEVNTGGIARYGEDLLYPSIEQLKTILNLNIPITINSDAHLAEHIGYEFEWVKEMLKELGFKSRMVLNENKWIEVEINQ